MLRWAWGLVALSAAVVAVVLALAWPDGLGGRSSQAGEIEFPFAYIDKNIYNGEGPCDGDYWDDVTTETVGSTHKLAVCIADLPAAVGGFELGIRYDDELDECEDVPCALDAGTCLDDNPDANAGMTTWGDGLGEGWSCGVQIEPRCDGDEGTGPQHGLAEIWCLGPLEGGSFTLGDDEPRGALAVLTLDVVASGTDEVVIDYLWVYTETVDSALIAWCGGDDANGVPAVAPAGLPGAPEMECYGAEDIKKPPPRRKTPTLTVTATPTEVPPTETPPPPPPPPPTATPFGGPAAVGISPPPTGTGPSGGSFPWTLMASLLAGTAGAAAVAGGVLRFARR
jgi:hypothetical protein